MVIEWLKFRVSPQSREKFIQKDAQIWTQMIASYPGFLGKEVWINPNAPEEIVLVIRWQTRQQWKSIPQAALEETEQQFAQQMGEDEYQMVESSEYQVRKFPQVST
ncbi:MAG: TIGR03792 family protein [Xenococcaceae cyanobacterium]